MLQNVYCDKPMFRGPTTECHGKVFERQKRSAQWSEIRQIPKTDKDTKTFVNLMRSNHRLVTGMMTWALNMTKESVR